MTPLPNSKIYGLSNMMRTYCTEILIRWGRDFTRCEQCGGATGEWPDLHHQRYAGATIHDLAIVCRYCNTRPVNRGLA